MVCNTGIRFDPLVQTKPLAFDFYGLYNGVVTMMDRNTKSVWLQVGGRAIKGVMTGTTLKTAPLLDTTWKRWKQLHPDTLVMSPDNPYRAFYEPKGTTPRGYDQFPSEFFEKSMAKRHGDNRLPQFEMVLAVMACEAEAASVGEIVLPAKANKKHYRAYPLKELRRSNGVLNDTLAMQPLAVFYDAETKTAAAFSRLLDGHLLTFVMKKSAGKMPKIYDTETQSEWTLDGKAVAGALQGRELSSVHNYLSEWYGWVAYFPQTSIYGQPDKSKPVASSK